MIISDCRNQTASKRHWMYLFRSGVRILIEFWYYFIIKKKKKIKKTGLVKLLFDPKLMRRTAFCADNAIATRHDAFYTFFSRPSIDTRALTNILYAITLLEPISFCGRNTADRYNCRRGSDWWTVYASKIWSSAVVMLFITVSFFFFLKSFRLHSIQSHV